MHELPLCEAVRDEVVTRAAGRAVHRIDVSVGAGHHATPEAFQQLFAQAAAGTPAAAAEIRLHQVPVTFACSCGASGETDSRIPLCPSCDEPVRPRGGDELAVTAVEYGDR